MPFKSESQKGYLFSNHPEIAKRWAKEYGVPKDLPKKVKKKDDSKYSKDVIRLAMKKHEKT